VGAYLLDIHGGDGRFECAITAQTFLQQRGAEEG
jgi:hypothetical protein